MSKECDLIALGEIAVFRNGLNFNKKSRGKGCLLIGVPDFREGWTPDYDSIGEINPEGIVKDEDYLLKGDILFVRSNGNKNLVGRSLFIDKEIKALFSGFCIRARITSKKVIPEFFAYYTKTNFFRKSISSADGTNINNLSQDILRSVKIPLFSLDEQKGIIRILLGFDAKIELNNRINDELEQMAKTLYDYWFVQFDFPNAKGKPYKSSSGEMVYNEVLKREVPKGWKVKKLYEIANITMGQSPSGASYNEEGKGMIFFQGSTDFGWRYPDERVFTTAPTRFAKQSDILLSVRAPIGTMNIAMNDCCIGRGLSALNSKDGFNSFLVYQMNYFKKKFDYLNSVGTTFGSLTKDELYNIELAYPPVEILKRFESIVSLLDNRIRINTQQNQQLAALRDWLLPMLMNGQAKVLDGYTQEEKPGMAKKLGYQKQTQLNIPNSKKGFAKQVLAGKIISLFRDDLHFTDIKFQKIQFLAEHIIQADLNLNYYYQAAGPYDNVFMHTIYNDLKKNNWYDCKDRKFIALEKQIKIEEYYQNYFGPTTGQLDKLFRLLSGATEAKSEIIATIYAVWNNFIIERKPVAEDELIQSFYDWSERKHQYTKAQVMEGLQWLRENKLEPTGFGKLIKKAKSKK